MPLSKHKNLLAVIYDGLPASVRRFISPVLEPANFMIKRVLSIASQIRLPVYQFQGKNRWDNGVLTILLIGEEKGIMPYILDLFYAEEPTSKKLCKVFLWKVKSQIKPDIPGSDLVLVGVDEIFSRFLSRRGFIVIPEWVRFYMDLAKPFPTERGNKGLNANLRKIKKYGYSFEMTRDPEKLEYFYHQMYLPYSEKKHGKLSQIGGFNKLSRIFEKGGLILVKQGAECISGFLIEIGNKVISARLLGVKNGEIEYTKKGALAACYYFLISSAKEKGYKWVDFGHCRPFFNDGPFFHKKTWGMEIRKRRLTLETKAVLGMKVFDHKQGLGDFLSKNPFIFMDREKLKGLVLTQTEQPLTLDDVRALFQSYYIQGIDSIVVASSQGFTQQAEEFASSQSPQRLCLTNLKQNTYNLGDVIQKKQG